MTTEFNEDFKNKVLALALRDTSFCERTEGLIEPNFFEYEHDRYILSLALGHFKQYGVNPSAVSVAHKFKEDQETGIIRKEVSSLVSSKFRELYKTDVSDRDFVVDKVSEFARKQATINAIVKSSEIIDKGGDINSILPIVQKAIDIGVNDLHSAYDFKDKIEQRSQLRKARLNGEIEHNAVTTGYREFDKTLYRRGWGKGELSLYMAPSKAGKSIALLDHALRAAERGYNVLFVSLELSTEIQVDRMDSNVSGVKMDDLLIYIDKVSDKLKRWSDKSALLKLHEFPMGTYRVSDLRRLIKKYQSVGVLFDLVVVDYADVMLSESSSTENIDKSKQVLVDLRALAQQENLALLSATQTNRDGAKADTIEAIHVAEDYNKIRIADLVISINANEIEKSVNEGRLYYAASRNQKPVTLHIKRDLKIMRHISEVIEVKG